LNDSTPENTKVEIMDKEIVDLCRAARSAADWFYCHRDRSVSFSGREDDASPVYGDWDDDFDREDRRQSAAGRRVAKAILRDSDGTVSMGDVATLIKSLTFEITNQKIRNRCLRMVDADGLYCHQDWTVEFPRWKELLDDDQNGAIRRVAKAIRRESGASVTMGDVASLIEYVTDSIETGSTPAN
jgi:hypothetical protein